MKCPKCGYEQAIYDDVNEWWHCPQCHGSGEVQMTEQEYLQTCNTEQLANVFFEYRYANATPRQKLWMSASEKCIKTDIVEWLKQPHRD